MWTASNTKKSERPYSLCSELDHLIKALIYANNTALIHL